MKRAAFMIALVCASPAYGRCWMDFSRVSYLTYSYHNFGYPSQHVAAGTTVIIQLGSETVVDQYLIAGSASNTPAMQLWNVWNNGRDNNATMYSKNLVTQGGVPVFVRMSNHSGSTVTKSIMDAVGMTTGTSMKHNSYYYPEWVPGMPARVSVDDDSWCNAAYQGGGDVIYRHKATMPVTFVTPANLFPSTTTTYEYELVGTIERPFSSTVTPSSIAFGTVPTGTNSSRDLTVKTTAFPGARHTISFVYSSVEGRGEVLTVDNKRLPYATKRTVPSGISSSTNVFKIGISNTVSGDVKGRLQVTNTLD